MELSNDLDTKRLRSMSNIQPVLMKALRALSFGMQYLFWRFSEVFGPFATRAVSAPHHPLGYCSTYMTV